MKINNEEKAFNDLVSRNPNKGTKNNIVRIDNTYIIPAWVFGENLTRIRYKTVKRTCIKFGITDQILYDVLQLGLEKLEDRPKCPICGKLVKFKDLNFGYFTTCSNKNCISELARREVTELWKDDDYKKSQIDTKKRWMNLPEKLEFFRNRAISQWQNDDYRKKQVESHIAFCKNNPDKIMNGIHGEIDCAKSSLKKLYYDSSWERDFISFCESSEIVKSINRAGISIPYFDEECNVYRNYFPDFSVELVNNKKLLVEIKSDWLFKEDLTKIKLNAGKDYVFNSDEFCDFLIFQENDLYVVGSKPVFKSQQLTQLFNKYI